MRGQYWWPVVALALMPIAAAAPSNIIQVEAQLDALQVDGPSTVTLRDALLRAAIDPTRVGEAPLVTIAGGVVHVRQYWLNSTSVLDPLTGNILYRMPEPWASKDLAITPDRIHLVNPIDRPDVRLRIQSVFGVDFANAQQTHLENGRSPDVLGPSRAYGTVDLDLLRAFDQPPADGGWAAFSPGSADGFGDVDYLIDGWGLTLGEGDHTLDVRTGTRVDYVHRFGEGGQVRESYSFLHIMVLGGHHTFAPQLGRFEGFASGPEIKWEGPADLRIHGGRLGMGTASVPLTEPDLRLDGRFQSTTEFGPDAAFAGAPFHATGTGTTDAAFPRGLLGTVPIPQQAGFWTSLAVGSLAVAVLGVQTFRRPRQAPLAAPVAAPAAVPPQAAPAGPMGLEQLIERAQKAPLDGEAQFDLGVALVKHGEREIGARALDRSFRLQPGGIVKLLEDPALAGIRDSDEVRQLLGRFQREQHRKVWAGYA